MHFGKGEYNLNGRQGRFIMNKLLIKYRRLPVHLKASLWYVFCGLLQKGISLLTTPLFTRIMTQAEYGQFNVYLSWFGVLSICISLNLSYSVYLQGLVKYEEDKDVFTSSLLGLTSLLTGIAFVVYLLFSTRVNSFVHLSTPIMICMVVSTWTEAVFSFWSGRLRNDFEYKPLVLLSIAVAVAKPVLGIVLIFLFPGHGVEARVISMTIIEVAAYLGLFVRQINRGKKLFHKYYWRYAISYNLPLIPHYLSQTVLSSSDRIMIADMINEESAAIYSLAYSLGMIMVIVNTALSNTFTPWVYQKLKRKDYKDIGKYSCVLLSLVAAANILLVLFAPEIIRIFAPVSYQEAVWLIPPIAIGTFFMFMYNIFANFAFYFEKTKSIMLGSCSGAILNLILNYFFIRKYGYQAAAYTTFFCYFLYALGHYMFMRFVCNECIESGYKIFDTRIIVAISILFIAMVFAVMQLYHSPNGLLRYGLFILLVLLTFFGRRRLVEIILKMKGKTNE